MISRQASATAVHPDPLDRSRGVRGRRDLLALVLPIALVIAVVAKVAVIAPLVAAAAVAGALPRRVALPIRMMLTAPLIVCGLLMTTAVLQPVGIALHPLAAWMPMTLVASVIRSRSRRGVEVRDTGVDARNAGLWAVWIAGAVVVAFLLSAGLIPGNGHQRSQEQRLALLAISEDYASHLAITDALTRAGGFAYGPASREATAQWPYPPGFHLAATSLRSALEHTSGTNFQRGGRFDALWFATILAFGFMVAASCMVTAVAIRGMAPTARTTAVLAVGAVMLMLSSWVPFNLFVQGYSPQLAALGLLATLVCIAMVGGELRLGWTLTLAAASLVAISWTWFFLTPIASIIIVAWLVLRRADVRGRWLLVVGIGIVSIAVSVPPMYFSLQTSNAGVLNAVGGGNPLTMSLIMAPAVLSLGMLTLLGGRNRVGQLHRRMLIIAIVTAVAFTLAIREYQLATAGNTAYFFDKSLFTVAILGTTAVAAGFVAVANRLPIGRWQGTLAVVLLLLAGFMSTDARPNDRRLSAPWLYRDGLMTSPVLPRFSWMLAHRESVEGRYMVAWEQNGNALADYGVSRWMNAVNGNTEERVFDFYYATVREQKIEDLAEFVDDVDGNVVILTESNRLDWRLVLAGAPLEDVERALINP